MPSVFSPVVPAYSYTAFTEAQGDASFPGSQLDNDLAAITNAINQAFDVLDGIVRSDGVLGNGVVTKNSLASDVIMGVPAPTAWVTAHTYALNDAVTFLNAIYLAASSHTSGVFATDLAAGRWSLLIEFAVDTNINDGAVTTAKLLDGAVTTLKLADDSVTRAKLGELLQQGDFVAGTGFVPVGAETDFAGMFTPPLWLLEFGQAISRTTYAQLFSVIAPNFIADVTNSSNTIVSALDLSAFGLVGCPIEGPGIPAGATINAVAGTTLTISAVANLTSSAAVCRLLPHGVGDGSATFNLPDARDRVTMGRGNMGGVAAGLLGIFGNSQRIGVSGGVPAHNLTIDELAPHTHTGTTNPAGGHSHTFPLGNNDNDGSTPPAGSNGALTGPSQTTSSAADHTHGFTTSSVGIGAYHQNLQPYRVSNRIIFSGVA